MSEVDEAAPVAEAPGRRAARLRGRAVGAGLLAAALGAVVALDTGVVPLPLSTPKPVVQQAARPGVPAATAAADAAREKAVRVTVTALDAALAADDVAAFGRLVDPQDAAAAKRLRRLARNLTALPAVTAGLDWDGSWGVDVSGGQAPDAATRIVAHAHLRTTFTGYDTGATPVAVDVGLHKVADRWLVTSWERRFLSAEPDPWDVDVDLAAVAKPHVLVVGMAKNARANARLASRAEAAIVDTRKVWTDPAWNGKAVVVALTDEAYLDTWFGAGLAGPGQKHADYFSTFVTEDALAASPRTGMRVVVATDFLLRDTRATRADLRYAFTVMSFRTGDTDAIPAWLYNGAADYTSWRPATGKDAVEAARRRGLYDPTWAGLRAGTWKPRFTKDRDAFGEGSDARVAADWDSAFLTATYVADTFGEARLRELVAATAAEPRTDTAVKKVLKMTMPQLSANVARYARRLAART
ncbi:hypothetical protein [Kineosporia sp. A_224]|uniref:hypothetical protein n=1 Tax=Kineosporia sp. A_224 TaxID=1962180 RepID=UPI00130439FD|nr:hypothetical protein [Kineosporia sp. A_224]